MKRPVPRAELVRRARRAREGAYAPYSHYRVGAAVRAASGRVYTGCNVENVSYGLTVCAERNAIFTAVAAGERRFDAIAVVTANGGTPCGACRQVLAEFMPPDATIIISDAAGDALQVTTFEALLPDAFSPGKLREGTESAPRRHRVQRTQK